MFHVFIDCIIFSIPVFRILLTAEKIPRGWRLSSLEDVANHQEKVRNLLQSHPWPWPWNPKWGIYKLSNGRIHGPGYNFLVKRDSVPCRAMLVQNIGSGK